MDNKFKLIKESADEWQIKRHSILEQTNASSKEWIVERHSIMAEHKTIKADIEKMRHLMENLLADNEYLKQDNQHLRQDNISLQYKIEEIFIQTLNKRNSTLYDIHEAKYSEFPIARSEESIVSPKNDIHENNELKPAAVETNNKIEDNILNKRHGSWKSKRNAMNAKMKKIFESILADNEIIKREMQNIKQNMEQLYNYQFASDEKSNMSSVDSSKVGSNFSRNSEGDAIIDEQQIARNIINVTSDVENPPTEEKPERKDTEEEPNLTQSYRPGILRRKSRRWRLIYNTESIHMYAITLISPDQRNSRQKGRAMSWLMAIFSLCIVLTQLIVMSTLVSESTHPTCTSHTDCPFDEYCDASDNFRQPRCSDCSLIDYKIWDEICENNQDVQNWNFDEVDHNVLWFTKDHEAMFNPKFSLSHDSECLAIKHCKDNSLASIEVSDFMCPHLFLDMEKFSYEQMFAFFTFVILFASFLCQDIDESEIEEGVLDRVIESLPNGESPFCAFIIRLAIRVRRLILPWITAAAGTAVILSDNLSAMNILLNLLAVLFVTEIDSLVASFFISPYQRGIVNEFIEETKLVDGYVSVSFWTTRIYGLAAALMMFIMCLANEFLLQLPTIKIFGDGGCSHIDILLWQFFIIVLPFISMVMMSLYHLAYSRKSEKVLYGLLDISRNFVALYVSNLVVNLLETSIIHVDSDLWSYLIGNIVGLFSSIVLGVRIHYILKSTDIGPFTVISLSVIVFCCFAPITMFAWISYL